MNLRAILLLVCLFFSALSFAQPGSTADYKGFRIELTNFNVVKKKSRFILVQVDVVNTGKYSVLLHPLRTESNTTFYFDASFSTTELEGYQTAIIEALKKTNRSVNAGELLRAVPLKISTKDQNKAFNPIHGDIVLASQKKSDLPSSGGVQCPDLVIDTIILVKQKKSKVVVDVKIANLGNQFVDISKVGGTGVHSLSVKVFFCALPKMTKGAIDQPGFFVVLPKGYNGVLLPQSSIVVRQTIDISEITRFSPYILLQLDPLLEVPECVDKNNEKTLFLKLR